MIVAWKGFQTEYMSGDCTRVYGSLLGCIDVIIFGSYQFISLLSFSIFFSLIPFYFLKEGVYKTWRKFALVTLPVLVIIVLISPTRSGNDFISFGNTQEQLSMLFSVLFLIASWGIAVYHHLLKK